MLWSTSSRGREKNNIPDPESPEAESLCSWWSLGSEPVSKEFSGVPGKLNDPGPAELGI
mgnify:CR=1 FL=1